MANQPPPDDAPLYNRILIAHAVLGIACFLFLFPAGAVAVRFESTRAHIVLQSFTYAVFAAVAGWGIWMARTID